MVTLHKFYDLIQRCNICDKNLLLGNGFSIAFSELFRYDSILKESSFNNSSMFYNTSDYEKVIEDLNFKRDIYQQAYAEYGIASMFENWSDKLKWDLVNTIIQIQLRVKPNYRDMHNTFLFLSNFSNIFTLNYDLLLYWVVNYGVGLYRQNKHEYYSIVSNNKFYLRDGFYHYTWNQDKYEQNVFYLHGGLHLFFDKNDTYKLANNKEQKHSIIKQTQNRHVRRKESPLVIIEGNSNDKLRRINDNAYLKYCYQKLNQIKGVVLIYGHSLDYNDEHIFKTINANPNINAVYISIFAPVTNEETIRQKAYYQFAERIKDKSLIVDFYNAQSVALW